MPIRRGMRIIWLPGRCSSSLSVQDGGSLEADGATISAPLSSTGASMIRICNSTTASAPISITGTTGTVVVGEDDGKAPCAGNTVGAKVQITGNSGGIE